MANSTDHGSPSHNSSPGSASDRAPTDPSGDLPAGSQAQDGPKKPKDPKDPSRPRRKKARRACHACQRAHLTCGDERPCQRCIKRGLAEQCCDGVRKKAKYLHDTPEELFRQGGMSNMNNYADPARNPSRSSNDVAFGLSSPATDVFSQMSPQSGAFPVYRPATYQNQIPDAIIGPQPYVGQNMAGMAHLASPQDQHNMQTLLDAARQTMSAEAAQPMQDQFNNPLFDTNDPSKIVWDTTGYNFDSNYVAGEHVMLQHITTGVEETPPSDSGMQYGQSFASPVGVGGFPEDSLRGSSFSMAQDQSMADWQQQTHEINRMEVVSANNPEAQVRRSQVAQSRHLPAAIPINVSHTRDIHGRLLGTLTPPINDTGVASVEGSGFDSTQASPQLTRANIPFVDRASTQKPTSIYDTVTKGYDYVQSWHVFRALLQARLPDDKAKAIAKSLATIRPSFIAANRALESEDLVFQEKCFQRTLMMYDDFMAGMCTPTIILRRTGEVAAMSNEFCTLTGWSRSVSMGREPNLNENRGYSRLPSETASGTASAAPHGGMNTPRAADAILDPSKLRPVYIAELLDEDSIVRFYEDFARMAFNEARGRVQTRVSVRKYRTKADMANSISGARGGADPDSAADRLLDRFSADENFVDCACIWTIKRDPFETPMMILMNFLPCL